MKIPPLFFTDGAKLRGTRGALTGRRLFWLLFLVVAMLVAEVLVRGLGFINFPLYDANAVVGYIPAARQQGSFLNRNKWEFNSLHMGAAEFTPSAALDVLLIGDSIVFGGNSYQHQAQLGPALQAILQSSHPGGAVWPISAGSWALRNELAWLRTNPQVVARVDRVLFVVNSGDFGEATSWNCEATHPRKKPVFALGYLFNKYVFAFVRCGRIPNELKVPPGNLAAELTLFLNTYGDKTLFVLYPDRAEALNAALAESHFAPYIALLKSSGARNIFQLAGNERLQASFYKDDIHPTPEGNQVLAGILARWIAEK